VIEGLGPSETTQAEGTWLYGDDDVELWRRWACGREQRGCGGVGGQGRNRCRRMRRREGSTGSTTVEVSWADWARRLLLLFNFN
jgi:hypothetical protein